MFEPGWYQPAPDAWPPPTESAPAEPMSWWQKLSWSDIGHGALDVVGLFPVVGEPADLLNAAWHAADGNYLDAGLSLISMIPGVGDVIGKGGKLVIAAGGVVAGSVMARRIAKAIDGVDVVGFLSNFKKDSRIGPHIDKIRAPLMDFLSKLNPQSAIPGGRLWANEFLYENAHVIARHVGRTDSQLANRLASQHWVPRASTFASLGQAEAAVSTTLKRYEGRIQAWLGTTTNDTLVLESAFADVIGRSLVRGDAATQPVRGLRVVLRKDPLDPNRFFLVTAFPEMISNLKHS